MLGLNEHCRIAMGSTNSNQVIGKTPYDFYSKEIANHILKHNNKVIESGDILSQDEKIKDITTGSIKIFNNIKAPLYDSEGNITGIIGSAIDVTEERILEKLRAENIQQKSKIETYYQIVQKYMNSIQNNLQLAQLEIMNDKMGNEFNSSLTNTDENIKLTKREQEVLYLLSLGKSPKTIAEIIGRIENKVLEASTIGGLINKKLYKKFNVSSVDELLEKAILLKLTPFLPDSFINIKSSK